METLHLGNGCSACAIDGGRSIDTTMGLTPLEGLVMGTRSGDLDPALVLRLARELGIEQTEQLLNKQSGLLGVSGRSQDMRDLLTCGDADATLAIDGITSARAGHRHRRRARHRERHPRRTGTLERHSFLHRSCFLFGATW